MKLTKTQFYILSFTWGLPYTLLGLLVALVLLAAGKRPRKWGWCRYFIVGRTLWGGANFGLIFLVDPSDSDRLKTHEFGHALQNCFFGPAQAFLVSIPSACRYWVRRIAEKHGHPPKTAYDDAWFDGQATRLGTKKMRQLQAQ